MAIRTQCPACRSLFRLPEALATKTVRCQKCSQLFMVPVANGNDDVALVGTAVTPSEPMAPLPTEGPPAVPESTNTDTPAFDTAPEEAPPPAVQTKPETPIVLKLAPTTLDDLEADAKDAKRSPRWERDDDYPSIEGRRRREPSARSNKSTPEKPKATRGVVVAASLVAVVTCLAGFGVSLAGIGFTLSQPNIRNMPQPRFLPQAKQFGPGVAPNQPVPQPNGPVVVIQAKLSDEGNYRNANEYAATDPGYPPNFGHLGRYKEYVISLKRNQEYILDLMTPPGNDAYLLLLDRNRLVLSRDDDGGGNLNSRIRWIAQYDGDHIIHATTLGQNRFGKYDLIVREANAPMPVAKAPLAPIIVPKSAEAKDPLNIRNIETNNPGVVAQDITAPANVMEGQICWSADAKAVFVLGDRGLLSRVRLDGWTLERTLRLNQRCSHLCMSAEGLLVSLIDLNEAWLIDPATLDVKKRISMPQKQKAYSAPGAKIAIAVGDQFNAAGPGVLLLDLEKGEPVAVFPMASRVVALSQTGSHFFVMNPQGQPQRYRIDGRKIHLEATGPFLGQAASQIVRSPDGKQVAFTAGIVGRGGMVPPGAIPGMNPGGNILPGIGIGAHYSVFGEDLQKADFVVPTGYAFAPLLAFDPAAKAILTVGRDDLLRIHDAQGKIQFEKLLQEPGPFPNQVKDISAHPEGRQVIVLLRNRWIHVDWRELEAKKE